MLAFEYFVDTTPQKWNFRDFANRCFTDKKTRKEQARVNWLQELQKIVNGNDTHPVGEQTRAAEILAAEDLPPRYGKEVQVGFCTVFLNLVHCLLRLNKKRTFDDLGEDEPPSKKNKSSAPPIPSPERVLWYDPALPTSSQLLASIEELPSLRSIEERLVHLERLEHLKEFEERLEDLKRLEHLNAVRLEEGLQRLKVFKERLDRLERLEHLNAYRLEERLECLEEQFGRLEERFEHEAVKRSEHSQAISLMARQHSAHGQTINMVGDLLRMHYSIVSRMDDSKFIQDFEVACVKQRLESLEAVFGRHHQVRVRNIIPPHLTDNQVDQSRSSSPEAPFFTAPSTPLRESTPACSGAENKESSILPTLTLPFSSTNIPSLIPQPQSLVPEIHMPSPPLN